MDTTILSPQKRQDIIDALRHGTVPGSSLDAFAIGLEGFAAILDEELHKVRAGGSVFKAVRGEYGCGKTFFARWLADQARKMGFATSEVQIAETETPLHRLETVYRRLTERLATADTPQGALRNMVDGWFFTLEEGAPLSWRPSADAVAGEMSWQRGALRRTTSKDCCSAPTICWNSDWPG